MTSSGSRPKILIGLIKKSLKINRKVYAFLIEVFTDIIAVSQMVLSGWLEDVSLNQSVPASFYTTRECWSDADGAAVWYSVKGPEQVEKLCAGLGRNAVGG